MKKGLLYLVFTLIPFVTFGQMELGLKAGVSSYSGDLSPSGVWSSFGEMHFAAGVLGRYNIGNKISVRLGFDYAKISADDFKSNSGDFRSTRNLNFRSNIFELALIGEWNILGYQPYNLEKTFSPYLFLGVAAYNFKPQAYHEGSWHNLQPLGTEGQGMAGRPEKYKLTQLSIPFGAGVKYAINDQWNLNFEVGVRKTNTDYLDDVSTIYMDLTELAAANGELAAELSYQGDILNPDLPAPTPGQARGNSDNLDWYFISGIIVSYNFTDNGLVGSRNRVRRKAGCATF